MEEFVMQLWLKFHKALLNYIKKNISNPEDAEDILQTVFLKIHKNIHTLMEKEKVLPWLYQITRNTIIDSYRTNGKTKAKLLPYMDSNMDSHMDSNFGIPDDAKVEAWDLEISSCVKKMIAELPEKYAGVLTLYEFDGLSHKEIAQRLGISISGSKTRVQRSREKMKALLICGCRTETEANTNRNADSKSPCSYLVKMGKANLCLQRRDNS